MHVQSQCQDDSLPNALTATLATEVLPEHLHTALDQ